MASINTESRYNHTEIEKKWQGEWRKKGIYQAKNNEPKKFYSLVELTYTSGDLHIGHWFAWSAPDVYARYMRMQGHNVLFPVGGFDAFGLPAENAAIKHGENPKKWTDDNVKRMREQFSSMGPSFDWDKEVITSDPDYYRWTQWLFIKLYEAGLIYRANMVANWCPECQTVLANEHVVDGCCWRHSETKVIQKEVPQWLVKITQYADKLIWPFDSAQGKPEIDWPKELRDAQNSWIGRSEGVEVEFKVQSSKFKIQVFTTRPDTIYGATFIVVAPEHPLVAALRNSKFQIPNSQLEEIENYIQKTKEKLERERLEEAKEKTGVFTGAYAVNPISGEKIPVWIADFVLMAYGTGAIMGVPAHDKRDFDFAKKFDLPVRQVIEPTFKGPSFKGVYSGEGKLINSGEYTGLDNEEAKKKLSNYIIEHQLGQKSVHYHLRDWTISRQRYWGAPIPIIYCGTCGVVLVPESDLPVTLPDNVDFTPTGKPPLAWATDWVKVKCPTCGGDATREVETLDTYVDSSWYFLRYPSAHSVRSGQVPFDPKLTKEWLPAKVYFGGTEHVLGHTLYARFVTKVLHDLGYLPFDEFALVRRHHGVIMGPDGHRMSKSRGNVVNPDEQVAKYGADAVRAYLCFLGPHDKGGTWQLEGIEGMAKFLGRVWRLANDFKGLKISAEAAKKVMSAQNKTIKRVTEDIERFQFNTPLARIMEFTNILSDTVSRRYRIGISDTGSGAPFDPVSSVSFEVWKEAIETLIQLLAPYAPHMAEEMWVEVLGQPFSVHTSKWPEFDIENAVDDEIDIAIQVNGKLRGSLKFSAGDANDKGKVEKAAKADPNVMKWLEGKDVANVVFVPGRIINFVTRD